ncbi:hypothetical protein HPB47_003073 [Ixodes persulcatus]|uniref:Uncharacterized protein n=1 Tax=Ixodes persulcatus TaxID=34615 RepID=A0AC60PJF6_IXOPE|nr:hypothetical protein HPB47_003073 [Ixodes persulcatus]
MDEAQASTSTIIKDGYEIPPIHCTAETMSSSSSTIVSTNDELHSDDGDYEDVHGKKRRKTSQSSASHSKEKPNLQVGFTVLYMPTDTSKVASLSKFKLIDYLNNVAPNMELKREIWVEREKRVQLEAWVGDLIKRAEADVEEMTREWASKVESLAGELRREREQRAELERQLEELRLGEEWKAELEEHRKKC